MIINGTNHDGMSAWHVLNSDLRKSLGFVTPFFGHGYRMWKHESSNRPAYYNAVDAAAAGTNYRGTLALLKKHGMWTIYNEFICELDPVFSAMTRAGMPVDIANRIESSKMLMQRREAVREHIQTLVPQAIRPILPKAGYVRPPKDVTGLVEVTFNGIAHRECPGCGEREPAKKHFKPTLTKSCTVCLRKWTAKHTAKCIGATLHEVQTNPCAGLAPIEVVEGEKRWARVLPFVPSTKGIANYQKHFKHPQIFFGQGKERKATTDAKAVKKLIGKWPEHEFYKLVLEDRELTKLGGTYIGWHNAQTGKIEGGFPLGKDGCVHGHFTHSPSTLRSSMVSPNLQNLPRGDAADAEDIQILVKRMFVAPYGHTFVARDFSGIEAVLVGLHAGDRDFFRLARLDIHSYFTGCNLVRLGLLGKADMPDLNWSDKDLVEYGKQVIKKRFKAERDIGKRCIHAGNYRVGAYKLSQEYPEWFPKVKDAAAVLGFFYEVFPKINEWHEQLCLQVDRSAVYRNSFGHVQRFYQVLKWKKAGGKWVWEYDVDAKRLIAGGPQSDAAFIGKRAGKRLFYNYPDSMAQWLRLFIHDEWLAMVPEDRADEADQILQYEMEQPVPECLLPESWGYGKLLQIGSEGKRGKCWAEMH